MNENEERNETEVTKDKPNGVYSPDHYQLKAASFATGGGKTLIYAILGAIEELGELVDKLTFEQIEEKEYHTLFNDIRIALYGVKRNGEEAGRIAKFIRKNWDSFNTQTQNGLTAVTVADGASKECGDIAWMLAGICTGLGFNLREVMEQNIAKLSDRKNRGVIVGSGDNR